MRAQIFREPLLIMAGILLAISACKAGVSSYSNQRFATFDFGERPESPKSALKIPEDGDDFKSLLLSGGEMPSAVTLRDTFVAIGANWEKKCNIANGQVVRVVGSESISGQTYFLVQLNNPCIVNNEILGEGYIQATDLSLLSIDGSKGQVAINAIEYPPTVTTYPTDLSCSTGVYPNTTLVSCNGGSSGTYPSTTTTTTTTSTVPCTSSSSGVYPNTTTPCVDGSGTYPSTTPVTPTPCVANTSTAGVYPGTTTTPCVDNSGTYPSTTPTTTPCVANTGTTGVYPGTTTTPCVNNSGTYPTTTNNGGTTYPGTTYPGTTYPGTTIIYNTPTSANGCVEVSQVVLDPYGVETSNVCYDRNNIVTLAEIKASVSFPLLPIGIQLSIGNQLGILKGGKSQYYSANRCAIPGGTFRNQGRTAEGALLALKIKGKADVWKISIKSNKFTANYKPYANQTVFADKVFTSSQYLRSDGSYIIPFNEIVPANNWSNREVDFTISGIGLGGINGNLAGVCGHKIRMASPVVLDLTGSGQLKTIHPAMANVNFDLTGSGQKRKIGWVPPTYGFLALDLNGNGQIDDGRELFGDSTRIADDKLAANGYEALAKYDLNGDGMIDSKDAVFAKLKVWVDVNMDGISQPDEIKSLAEMDITGLATTYKASTSLAESEAFGNSAPYESRFFGPKHCGSAGCKSYDVYFGAQESLAKLK